MRAEIRRRAPRQLFERARKVALIRKAQIGADRSEKFVRAAEQSVSLIYARLGGVDGKSLSDFARLQGGGRRSSAA